MPYYHGIVYGVREQLGEDILPELSLESINVFKLLNLCKHQQYDELTEYLFQAIRNLAAAGAEFAALSANTPHIVFDRLVELSPIPLVSIIEATCAEAKRRNLTRIGLLGTIFTMTGEFFIKPFAENGIEVIVPTEAEMQYINTEITGDLEVGIVKSETLQGFQKIIKRMETDSGIEAIVLGCTELPIMLSDQNTPVPCLDTMKIHVAALVDEILK